MSREHLNWLFPRNILEKITITNESMTRFSITMDQALDFILDSTQNGKAGEIYNVGNGKEISVNSIAKIIGGKKVNIPKRPGEPDRSKADISKIKKQLGWSPKISINKGVKLLLEDINKWSGAPVWTPKTISKATKAWFKLLSKKK